MSFTYYDVVRSIVAKDYLVTDHSEFRSRERGLMLHSLIKSIPRYTCKVIQEVHASEFRMNINIQINDTVYGIVWGQSFNSLIVITVFEYMPDKKYIASHEDYYDLIFKRNGYAA